MADGMGRLLHDRYFEYAPARAWDLATGEPVATAHLRAGQERANPSLASLIEVLEHGVEGTPRWIVADVPARSAVAPTVTAAADAARRRGFVPIGADVYLRLRTVVGDELAGRALLLLAPPAVDVRLARAALVDAASRTSRPHVLFTLRTPAGLPAAAEGYLVHEARAVYGSQPARQVAGGTLPDDVARHVARASRAMEFVRSGRHAAAERLLRDVIGALTRRRAFGAAADMGLTLGKLFLERGQAAAADVVFGEAVEHADGAGDESLVMAGRIWQAAARTDIGQLAAAESLCRSVLVAGAVDEHGRARAEAALARVLLWQGRGDDARQFAFVTRAAQDLDPWVEGTAVRVLVETGDLFAAGGRARALLSATETDADPLSRVIGLGAHIRVLLATGDLPLVEERVHVLHTAAREARSPLRVARTSLLLVDALRHSGRERDAAVLLRGLARLRGAVPPLLRTAIEQRLREPARTSDRPRSAVAPPALATSLVSIAQRENSDRDALTRLLEFTAETMRSSRLDLWSADAGPVTSLVSVGTGIPTRLGARVLEAGIAIGPDPGDPAREIAVPLRLGERLVAAFAARWPADASPRADASDILQLAAAVAAPRVDSLLSAARAVARAATAIPELVGESAAITEVRVAVTRAAASPFAVLIDGESGVGKELVARAIHQLSPRRERRFCDVNCAALPDDLLESELFGHSRGAFTGAVAERAGLVEEADGGTLFLDEVLDLSLRAQAKLLRVVQQQELRRVGETFSRKVDVRFVSAANRDIRAEAAAGRFRQDLLYRLDVIRIHLPPLRERPEDVPLLAEHLWRLASARVGSSATLGHGVLAALSRYHWPGNVRELQNVLAALAVAAPRRGVVRPALLPPIVTGASAVISGRLAEARAQFERRFLEVALARAGGSRAQAAREIGLSRQGLLKLMTRLGMS
jgi:DNA-binding NtrC family response regulator